MSDTKSIDRSNWFGQVDFIAGWRVWAQVERSLARIFCMCREGLKVIGRLVCINFGRFLGSEHAEWVLLDQLSLQGIVGHVNITIFVITTS